MPIEIVMNILETAYHDNDLQCNIELFLNCALVCKDWSFLAQKLLFRHVTLRTQTAYISFQQSVDRSTPRGRMLGDAVQLMRVTLDHNQPYRLCQRSFARAVMLCPNLFELSIALYGQGAPGPGIVGSPDESRMKRPAPSFDKRTLALLRSGPNITALQFSNWSDNSSSLFQLLDVWPSLRFLDISGTPPQLPPASAEVFTCTFEGLRMNFQIAPSVDFMKWLLQKSTTSLRTLEVVREPAPEMLEYVVSEHGAALQSLALPACSSRDGVAILSRCDALRELRIESAWVPPAVYKALPETMEHLALGVDMDTSLQPVVQAIKRSEVLKTVTMHLWLGGEHHPLLNRVKIACAVQGVDLRFTRDIRAFRTVTQGIHGAVRRTY
ncbi:hypothetical protein AcV5_005255 [Taiwanofungus camphoratus]|nr:hypothetical protein AcV5_005255 [Antrodia cinnamomea]KAI0962530.1 hypothetical protein AcV7_001357 [Antrodia cinnamomea]